MAGAPSDGTTQDSQIVMMLLFYGALMGIFYFLLIRPQSQKTKAIKNVQDTLKQNDRVVTNGGLLGNVHKVEEDVVTIEVAENVRVKVQRTAIFERISDS